MRRGKLGMALHARTQLTRRSAPFIRPGFTMVRNYPMTESEVTENVKRSLKMIRIRVDSQKDALLNLLLDMTILHLTRKYSSATDRIDRPTTQATLDKMNTRIIERNYH